MSTGPIPVRRAARASGKRAGDRSAARQASLREHNLTLVLRQILESTSPPSRADIAAATSLTRATVSVLVDRLLQVKLIRELEPHAPQRVGRPAIPLAAASGTIAAIGIEVNIDYLGVCALDLSGELVAERMIVGDFRDSDPRLVLARVAVLVADVVTDLQVGGIRVVGACVALPGLVDSRQGPLRHAPNLGWRDLDVSSILREHPVFHALPLRLANEANLAARAEATADGDAETFLYVSGDIGIGAALVLNGEVYRGRHGWSGEIGHTVVDPHGPLCSCGSAGCLERFAGKDALMLGAGLSPDEPIGLLLDAAARRDERALQSIADAGRALGVAIANFVNLVDVDHVVLGGIYAALAPYLFDAVVEQLRSRVLSAPWASVTVRAATVGSRAAMIGGAQAILRRLISDPASWVERGQALAES
jgi:predicted NBD/HSP70 family sugar kinase